MFGTLMRRAALALTALAACSPGGEAGPGPRDVRGEFRRKLQACFDVWSNGLETGLPREDERRAEAELVAFVERHDAREMLVEAAMGARSSFAFRERLLRLVVGPSASATP
jgi:hypothetical protein